MSGSELLRGVLRKEGSFKAWSCTLLSCRCRERGAVVERERERAGV